MAAFTHKVTTPDTGNTPNTSGNITPVAGDLMILLISVSDTLTDPIAPTNSQGITFTRIRRETYNSGANGFPMEAYVANSLVTAAQATLQSITVAPGDTGSGSIISIYCVSGMGRAGIDAVRQSAGQSNQSAGTPAPAFSVAALTQNPCIGFMINNANLGSVSPPSGWTEGSDTGYSTPNTGIETAFINNGFTGTTVTWGSASGTGFGSIIVELNPYPEGKSDFPSYLPPLRPISVACLTLAVNLLQTTLKPEEVMGYNQYDWPLPLRVPSQLAVEINTRPVEDADKAFIPVDWRNPDLIKRGGQDWKYSILPNIVPFEQSPFFQTEWPLAVPKNKFNGDWFQSRPIFAEDLVPSNQFDWPNPLPVKRGGKDFLFSKQIETVEAPPVVPPVWVNPNKKAAIIVDASTVINPEPGATPPIRQTLNPIPLRAIKPALVWNYNPILYATPQVIPTPLAWPNPLPKKEFTQRGFIKYRQLEINVGNPIPGIVYPNPLLKKRTIIDFVGTTRIIPAPGTEIPSHAVWPNPLRKRTLNQDYRFYYVIDENVPFSIATTQVPLRKRISTLTWTQSPLVSVPIADLPGGQRYYELPLTKKRTALTWLNPSLSVNEEPFRQTEWPNPVRSVRYPVYDWIKEHPFYFEDTQPNRQNDYPNPLQKRIIAPNFVFVRQIEENEIARTLDYPNPLLKGRAAETHIVNLLGSTLFPGVGEMPFTPIENPVPLVGKKLKQDWLFWYIVDVNAPNDLVGSYSMPNPLLKRRNFIDWKYFSSIAESLRGASVTEVPLSKKRPVIDWIQNLQENSLGPLPVTSFSQKDWPNPLNKIRDRSLLTHISDYARNNQGTVPFRFTEWPVPVKRRIAGTWTDNPVLTIITPVGLKPFAQNDWPLVVRVRRGGQDYIQRAFILTSINGRVICLLSSVTEYQLESQLKDYDLESRFEIYELESGGDECQ